MPRPLRLALLLLLALPALPARAQWEQLAAPFPSNTLVRAFLEANGWLYAGTSRGLFRSPDDGQTWETVTGGLPAQVSVRAFAEVPGFLVMSTGSGLYRSATGTQWTAVGAGLGDDAGRVAHLLYVPGDGFYAGAGGNVLVSPGVYRSDDLGATWSPRNGGIPGAGPNDQYRGVNSMAAVGTTVLAGVSANFGEVSGTYRTENGGQSWTDTAPTLGDADALTTVGGTFVAGIVRTIQRSSDGGATWVAGQTLPAVITTLHARGAEVWASFSFDEPQRSLDGGVTWVEAAEALGTTRVSPVYVGARYVFGGTSSTNVWRRPAGGATAAEPGATAEGLALQVAPNPARGAATLTLSLDRPATATVAVYDLLGRRVAALHDGPLAAGDHAFRLAAAALPPGVYLARVVTDGAVLTHRLTVAR